MSRLTDTIVQATAHLPAPGRLGEQRAAAADAFIRGGLPNVKQENWRYTDISRLTDLDLRFAPSGEPDAANLDMLPLDGDRFVFVNGRIDESLSRFAAGASSEVSVLGNDWQALEAGFPRFGAVLEHPLGQINTATAQHGVLVRTPRGATLSDVIHVVLAHNGELPLALQPRIVLDLGENSSARVVVHYGSASTAPAWTNCVIEIRQAAGSRLELYQLQEHSLAHTQTALVSAALERDASATIACFDLGASLARNDIDIRLCGPGSRVDTFGTFLPTHSQHIDTHVCIDHVCADTQSRTNFRGIAGEKSRGVFNGKVIVRQNAQRIASEQRSDNLLLAKTAEIDTKPELEIYADDVKCSHGATVGELDEQHLFYLRSRGIDDRAARALLTYAFAQAIVDQISDAQLRSLFGARIARRLPEHERWEQLN